MKSRRGALLLALAALAPLAARSQTPVSEVESARRDAVKERKETDEWLKSAPDSYLAAIKRRDFDSKKVLTVGSAEDNDVRLDAADARPHHLRVAVMGDKFRVEAVDADANFIVGKSTGAAPVRDASVDPSALRLGRYLLRLSHQGYPAIIVFDPKSPRFKAYHGTRWFPYDPAYRFVVAFVPDASAATVPIPSTHSADRKATRVGWFDFTVGKTPCRVAAFRLQEPGVAADSMNVLFRDATTGKESYSVGRYVEPKKRADGKYTLDFNEASNPACAFSTRYNCPIPPAENHLAVRIAAGERDPHYH